MKASIFNADFEENSFIHGPRIKFLGDRMLQTSVALAEATISAIGENYE